MGIDINSYRIRIGLFKNNKVSNRSLTSQSSYNMNNKTKTKSTNLTFKIFLVISILLSILSVSCQVPGQDINTYARMTNGNRSQQGIKLAHWNKGKGFLQTKIHEVENIISGYHPHVLGLSESELYKCHDRKLVEIQNYNLITAKSLDNPNLNVSRVCVYVHNSIVYKVRTDLMSDSFSSVWLECGLPRQKKILICHAYREWSNLAQGNSNSGRLDSQLERWLLFLDQWERSLSEDREVIVMGDMNINFLNWHRYDLPHNAQTTRLRPLINQLFDRIFPRGVSQLVTVATRVWPGQEDTGLDHVYTNRPLKISPVNTHNCGGSDHKLLFTIRYAKNIKEKAKYVTKRCYKNFCPQTFINAVQRISWWSLYQCDEVDTAQMILSNHLTSILDRMAPIRTIQVRDRYAPWLSNETKEMMTNRNIAQARASQTKSNEDWKYFKSLRNKVNNRLKKEKENWQKQKLSKCESETNTGIIWKNVKSWIGWSTSGSPSQLFSGGQLLRKPSEIAECMNNFFVNKIRQIREDLPDPVSDPLTTLRGIMTDRTCTFSIKPVFPKEVLDIITNLKNSKSVGLDYIDTYVIKLVRHELLPAITHVINLSIRQSKFPTQFKVAKVIPLYKKDDKFKPMNYRPVAILPICSKILERVIFLQLVKYLEDNRIIHPNHHGFRSYHNTTTALLQMYDVWIDCLEQDKVSAVCLIDMSAAFDVVSHSLLLEKLELYGFDNSALSWMKSYLSDRTQCVCVDGTLSRQLSVDCGVPQGSILSPVLYCLFTNDFPDTVQTHTDRCRPMLDISEGHTYTVNCHECGSVCCYADDSTYYVSAKNPQELTDKLATKYTVMSDYLISNRLKVNTDKTHMLVMRTDAARRCQPNFTVQLHTGNEIIQPSTSELLLGGIINQNYKWTEFIRDNNNSLIKSLNMRLGALKKVSNAASFKTRKLLANGIFISKLLYLMPLWGGCEKYLIKSLQIIQSKAARVVTKCDKYTRISELLKQCGWLSVNQLIAYHSLIAMHKIIYKQSPTYLYMRTVTAVKYNTRYNANSNIQIGSNFNASRQLSKNSFRIRTANLWNTLDEKTKCAPKLSNFKVLCKKWILSNIEI